MHMTQSNRDPQVLTIHPLAKKQPGMWAKDDARLQAMIDDIAERGLDQPLIITRDGQIADGRNRWNSVRALQWKSVPCVICDDKDVPLIIVQSLLRRRHYTPSQRAYLLAPTIDDAFAEAHRRMLAGKSKPSALSAEGQKTPDQWADDIGVSIRLLRDARKVHELFKDDKKRQFTDDNGKKDGPPRTFKDYYEPRILDDEHPLGLGFVVSGIGFELAREKKGGTHKGGRPDKEADQLRLFNKLADDEDNRWEYWTKLSDDAKDEHFKHIREKASQIDDVEELKARAEYHESIAKEFRKQLKEAAANSAKK